MTSLASFSATAVSAAAASSLPRRASPAGPSSSAHGPNHKLQIQNKTVVGTATATIARRQRHVHRGSSTTTTSALPPAAVDAVASAAAASAAAASSSAAAAAAPYTFSQPSSAYLVDYVPSPMDTSALQAQLWVLAGVGVMTAYWWYVLVPGARVNLAVNKRSGKLRTYLEELKGDDSRKVERMFYEKWLAKVDPEVKFLLRGTAEGDAAAADAKMGITAISNAAGAGGLDGAGAGAAPAPAPAAAAAARTTRLSDTEGGGERLKEESLEDIIRKARNTPDFWSMDNPVLVGTAVTIGAGALFGAISGH